LWLGDNAAGRDDVDPEGVAESADLYRYVESWWGADFDDKLIDRMVNAPNEHLREFAKSIRWSNYVSDLPEVSTGMLRPIVVNNNLEPSDSYVYGRRTDGLRLLLYAHEVVLDRERDFFEPFDRYYYGGDADSLATELKQIARMRPLVENGSIRFAVTNWQGRTWRDPELEKRFLEVPEIRSAARELQARYRISSYGSEDDVLSGIAWSASGGIKYACRLAEMRFGQTLARTSLDQAMIRLFIQRRMIDKRQIALQKLATLKVPTMTGDIGTLVKLRQSDADFAEWRTRLGEALTYVGELGEGEESLAEASGVVYRELADGLSQVNKAVKKSPALQAVKAGLTGLAISGITGTTAEVITNDPLVALAVGAAGGSAGMFLEAGRSYVKALQARRKGRLIMDVSMLFDPSQGDT
jgi:hypothetical protein